MPLSKKDLTSNLPGLGDNTKILLKAKDGKLYQISSADLIGGNYTIIQGDEFVPGDDPTQQEAGAIKPTADEVLNNTSGVSFAASGSSRGISQEGSEVVAGENGKTNPSGQENKGTELGSGAIATQGEVGNKNAGAALPVTPQPDAGKASASGNSPAKK